jgi:membrane-bound lytic murein transglycosylase B
MTANALTRKSKALTIIPLALLSGAWTLNLVSTSASASSTGHDHGRLPDGSQVPTQAIEAPASVPVPGTIAPGVPQGTADQVVAGASSSGIPSPALSAYQRAAQIIDSADKTCNIGWELIGAIGRVESDHGRYGGNTLTASGVSKPGIYGPELNGKNGTQAIHDTDGGQLDHDPVYDRAVGPMQFIPSTWSVVQVDANGDGVRNPQDINDASLATAVYLCSGSDNLSTRKGQEAAVYRYNHSQDYVNLVLRIMEAYSQGDYTAVPAGASGGSVFSPSYTASISGRKHAAKARAQHAKHSRSSTGSTGGTSSGTTTGSTSGGSTTSGTGSTGSAGGTGGSVGGTLGGLTGGGGGSSPAPAPTAVPSAVAKTLSYAEAQVLCSNQLKPLATALTPVTQSMINSCASKVQGMTADNATATIPNSITAVLSWLGL